MSDVLAKRTGTILDIMPMNGKDYSLTEMQHYVGGHIETVDVGDGWVVVLDEEGKQKYKLPNPIATNWLLDAGIYDWVAGDAMLIERAHIK